MDKQQHKKQLKNLVILSLATSLLAIGLAIGLLILGVGDLRLARSRSRPTSTLVLARFTTATATAISSAIPAVEPTEPSTATPETRPTPEVTATSPDNTSTQETPATDVGGDETTFESPLAPPTPSSTATPSRTPTPTVLPPPPTATPTETPSPTSASLAGRIAFPIDDGAGHYDIWVVELPDGEPFFVQKGARQPNFSDEGRLLVNNHDSQYGEHIGLLDVNYTWLGLVSGSPHDGYPFWNPAGNLYVFSNPQLLLDPATGSPLPHVFIPCSTRRPEEEAEVKCRDIGTNGKVAIGEFPVWTDDDRIAFFGFAGDDGIYVVSGASKLWEAGGGGSPQLVIESNGRPSDTQGFQVFFSAGNLDQNWEAYAIDLDGTNLLNLSNSPTSQDGLPTVSPDGNWVAFVSNRDDRWGIWVVPRPGGEPTKIVDFSKINTNPSPWGIGDRDWTLERISWGP